MSSVSICSNKWQCGPALSAAAPHKRFNGTTVWSMLPGSASSFAFACCMAVLCSHYNELLQGSNGTEGETTSSIDPVSVVLFCARVQLLFSRVQKRTAKGETVPRLFSWSGFESTSISSQTNGEEKINTNRICSMYVLTFLLDIEHELLQWGWDCLACSKPTVTIAVRVTQCLHLTGKP